MKNIKLTNFIIKNEKFYKCLTKKQKEFISKLDTYNTDTLKIIPIHRPAMLNEDCTEDDYEFNIHNDDKDVAYIYIGEIDNYLVYYSVEYKNNYSDGINKNNYLFTSLGKFVLCKKEDQEFDFNNCILQ